jgi:hypothetical protein
VSDDPVRRTWKGLRADDEDCPTLSITEPEEYARDADARAEAREEKKWRALFESNLVNLEVAPVVQIARTDAKWGKCDDVEAHVLLRAQGGATIASILEESTHDRGAIVGALCRLAARAIVRFE